MTDVETLHDTLIKIRGNRLKSRGICMNILRYAPDNYSKYMEMFLQLAKYWPEYSGNAEYPVPVHFPAQTPKESFSASSKLGDMWTGEYGQARRRLLDFAIERSASEELFNQTIGYKQYDYSR